MPSFDIGKKPRPGYNSEAFTMKVRLDSEVTGVQFELHALYFSIRNPGSRFSRKIFLNLTYIIVLKVS